MLPHARFTKVALAVVLTASCCAAQQWQKTASSPKGSGITDLAVKQSNGYLFATTGSFDWPNADTGGVHRSTDGGNTWTRVFPAFVARVLLVHPDGRIFASVWDFPNQDESIYYSTDDGDTWILSYDGAPNNNIFCIEFEPGNPLVMWAGGRDLLLKSSTGGLPGGWTQITPVTFGVWAMQVDVQQPWFGIPGRVFLMIRNPTTLASSVYYSDGPPGMGWSLIQGTTSTDTLVSMIVAHDTTWGVDYEALYVGTFSGKIFKTSLVGPPFTFELVYEAPDLESINAFTEIDLEVGDGSSELRKRKKKKGAKEKRRSGLPEASGESGGVIETIDNGVSWQDVNNGLPTERKMSALANHVTSAASATVYAGMFLNQNDGAPVYSLDFTTDVEEANSRFPEKYSISQNYPNPFNPTTEIEYRIPETGHVSLRVYDLLGRDVATLVNETKTPGTYEVSWDATGQTSGVYFYRLTTGDFVQTRKLVLLR